jgi:hypothetical protein
VEQSGSSMLSKVLRGEQTQGVQSGGLADLARALRADEGEVQLAIDSLNAD